MERTWRENEEIEREWANRVRMRKWRQIHSLHFLIFSLFPSSLSISYIKNCLILSQKAKYGTFAGNVTKKLSYAPWENNSGSGSGNSLRESFESCASLIGPKLSLNGPQVFPKYSLRKESLSIPKVFHNPQVFPVRPKVRRPWVC